MSDKKKKLGLDGDLLTEEELADVGKEALDEKDRAVSAEALIKDINMESVNKRTEKHVPDEVVVLGETYTVGDSETAEHNAEAARILRDINSYGPQRTPPVMQDGSSWVGIYMPYVLFERWLNWMEKDEADQARGGSHG